MKLTLILFSILIFLHLTSALRSKSRTNTLSEDGHRDLLQRKKFKQVSTNVTTSATQTPATNATATETAAPANATATATPAAANGTNGSAKVDTSGAGPVDVNAGALSATGIETAETSPPVSRCTQSVGIDGFRIKDLYNYNVRDAAHLKMNIWNVNIFEKKDASTLVSSAEWSNIDFPITNITGAPECMLFKASAENDKQFAFCLSKEEDLDQWYDAIFAFKLCRGGVVPTKGGKRPCVSADANTVNYTDPLTGRTMTVADQSSASLIGGGGSGGRSGGSGCANCGGR